MGRHKKSTKARRINLSKTPSHKCHGVAEDRAPREAMNDKKALVALENDVCDVDDQGGWNESDNEEVWCTSRDSLWECLDSLPLKSTRHYSIQSGRFMNSYWEGLDGPQAAWACKKFNSHRTLPPDALQEARARV